MMRETDNEYCRKLRLHSLISFHFKWTYYSPTLQQITILIVVCSYLHIVTFLAVCMFLNFNVMNFKRKSFKFFVKGCREER